MIQKLHPVFNHDCDSCTFLGAKEVADQLYDFYSCQKTGSKIARYGSEGSHYLSLPSFLSSSLSQIEPFKTCIELFQDAKS